MAYKQGDLLSWRWKSGREPQRTHDVYWCKSCVVVVLNDGRWVDTYWHKINDTEHLWNNDTEIRPDDVDATFLVNIADLVTLSGPSEQYADGDTFNIINGGGGSRYEFMRKGAMPRRDNIKAILERRLEKAQWEESCSRREQERIKAQLVALNDGKEVRL